MGDSSFTGNSGPSDLYSQPQLTTIPLPPYLSIILATQTADFVVRPASLITSLSYLSTHAASKTSDCHLWLLKLCHI